MQWDSTLECGVELVDNEHRELFRIVESLSKNEKEGVEAALSKETLDFLGEYVATHFKHEEALMQECAYPYASEHQQLHAKFVQTFLNLKEKYEKNGESEKMTKEIYHSTMSWLINHIQVIDMRFTQYYKNRNIT